MPGPRIGREVLLKALDLDSGEPLGWVIGTVVRRGFQTAQVRLPSGWLYNYEGEELGRTLEIKIDRRRRRW